MGKGWGDYVQKVWWSTDMVADGACIGTWSELGYDHAETIFQSGFFHSGGLQVHARLN